MDRFETLTSVAAPLPQDDIDTDIIYPSRFLLITEKAGLGRYAFHDWRAAEPDFVLDRAPWAGAQILVTGANFGCGSSREQAPWALQGLGVRCVIAPSFGEIFHGNCFKNGILPIVATGADHAALMADAAAGATLTVDLAAGVVRRPDGGTIAFHVDPRRRDALIAGWDEIDLIRATNGGDIDRFEAGQRLQQPWLWAGNEGR